MAKRRDIDDLNKNMQNLLNDFNSADIDPSSLRDQVIKSFADTKSGIKPYTKKQAKAIFPDELTDEDIAELRADAERRLAIKQGLISEAQAGKTKQKRLTALPGSLKSSLKSIPKAKKAPANIKQKLEAEFIPQTKTLNKKVKDKEKEDQLQASLKSAKQAKPFGQDMDFEYNFLISTSGLLNGDVLFDILKETYTQYEHSKDEDDEDKKEDEKNKKKGSSLFKKLLGFMLLKGLFKNAFAALKGLGKGLLKGIGKLGAMVMTGIVKPFLSWLGGFLGAIWNKIKGAAKSAAKALTKAYNAAKSYLNKKVKGKKIPKKTASLKSAKNMGKTAKAPSKKIAKASGKKVGTKVMQEAKNTAKKASTKTTKSRGKAKAKTASLKTKPKAKTAKKPIKTKAKTSIKPTETLKKATKETVKTQAKKQTVKAATKKAEKKVVKEATKKAVKDTAKKTGKVALKKTAGKVAGKLNPLLTAGLIAVDAKDTLNDIEEKGVVQTGLDYQEEAYEASALENVLDLFNLNKAAFAFEALTYKGLSAVFGERIPAWKLEKMKQDPEYAKKVIAEIKAKEEAEKAKKGEANQIPSEDLAKANSVRNEVAKQAKQIPTQINQTPISQSYMTNPVVKTPAPQITYIEVPQPPQQTIIPKMFPQDSNELPVYGLGYMKEM